MKIMLEFYFQGECIEQREFNQFTLEPQVGDKVRIQLQNNVLGDMHGYYWRVLQRKILYGDVHSNLQTLMINVIPDQANGAWDNAPPERAR